jgi:hypothetical protein
MTTERAALTDTAPAGVEADPMLPKKRRSDDHRTTWNLYEGNATSVSELETENDRLRLEPLVPPGCHPSAAEPNYGQPSRPTVSRTLRTTGSTSESLT